MKSHVRGCPTEFPRLLRARQQLLAPEKLLDLPWRLDFATRERLGRAAQSLKGLHPRPASVDQPVSPIRSV